MVSVGEEGEGHSMWMDRRQKRRGNQQWGVWCEESKTRVTGGIHRIKLNGTDDLGWNRIKLNGPNDLGWNREKQT